MDSLELHTYFNSDPYMELTPDRVRPSLTLLRSASRHSWAPGDIDLLTCKTNHSSRVCNDRSSLVPSRTPSKLRRESSNSGQYFGAG